MLALGRHLADGKREHDKPQSRIHQLTRPLNSVDGVTISFASRRRG
jgi:hypothetical protein